MNFKTNFFLDVTNTAGHTKTLGVNYTVKYLSWHVTDDNLLAVLELPDGALWYADYHDFRQRCEAVQDTPDIVYGTQTAYEFWNTPRPATNPHERLQHVARVFDAGRAQGVIEDGEWVDIYHRWDEYFVDLLFEQRSLEWALEQS